MTALHKNQYNYDLSPTGLSEQDLYASFVNAKRIQDAILSPVEQVEKELGNAFIFFQPKDVVSGDFYWTYRICDQLLLGVADCSGHGIGGAIISVLAYAGLKKVVKDSRNITPSEILDEMNKYFHSILMIDHTNYIGTVDISLCTIDEGTGKMQFAGAQNPAMIIRDGKPISLKGDKHSIGDFSHVPNKKFTNHEFDLEKGDMLYLFSDGYRDQLGGPKGKRIMNVNFLHLLKTVAERPLDTQKRILQDFMDSWMERFPQTDDICVMGYKYE